MLTFNTIASLSRTSGSTLLAALKAKTASMRFRRISAMVAISFLLVGSCNQPMSKFSGPDAAARELASLSKADMMRYAYMLQAALADNPELFTHIDADKLRLVLASPDLTRKDGKTQSWQYRTASCVLDVFMTDNKDKVAHYEFRSTDALDEREPQTWQCLQSMYQDRRIAIEKSFGDVYADTRLDGRAG